MGNCWEFGTRSSMSRFTLRMTKVWLLLGGWTWKMSECKREDWLRGHCSKSRQETNVAGNTMMVEKGARASSLTYIFFFSEQLIWFCPVTQITHSHIERPDWYTWAQWWDWGKHVPFIHHQLASLAHSLSSEGAVVTTYLRGLGDLEPSWTNINSAVGSDCSGSNGRDGAALS